MILWIELFYLMLSPRLNYYEFDFVDFATCIFLQTLSTCLEW